jgi:hypothetical protein
VSASNIKSNRWPLEHRLLFGQATCLMVGVGIIAWGLAPAIMDRLITGQPPNEVTLSLNVACFIVALLYVGFHVLIKRRVRLAAWGAFALSALILATGVSLMVLNGLTFKAAFITFSAALACFASFVAIDAISNWSTEGPFARAVKALETELPQRLRFVADGPMRAGRTNAAAHQRMFMDNVDPRDARNVQPDFHRLSQSNEPRTAG